MSKWFCIGFAKCGPGNDRSAEMNIALQHLIDCCCSWVVDRLGANLQKELDFRFEAQNAQRFAECMAKNPHVAVPQLVPEVSHS